MAKFLHLLDDIFTKSDQGILIMENNEVEDSLEDLSDLAVLASGLLNTVLMFGVLSVIYKLPGHDGGGIWPLYIPEHYSDRTSAHLADPYSIAHVSHGALGFLLAFLTGDEQATCLQINISL